MPVHIYQITQSHNLKIILVLATLQSQILEKKHDILLRTDQNNLQ
jgi:hypothetical protein